MNTSKNLSATHINWINTVKEFIENKPEGVDTIVIGSLQKENENEPSSCFGMINGRKNKLATGILNLMSNNLGERHLLIYTIMHWAKSRKKWLLFWLLRNEVKSIENKM